MSNLWFQDLSPSQIICCGNLVDFPTNDGMERLIKHSFRAEARRQVVEWLKTERQDGHQIPK